MSVGTEAQAGLEASAEPGTLEGGHDMAYANWTSSALHFNQSTMAVLPQRWPDRRSGSVISTLLRGRYCLKKCAVPGGCHCS